MQEEISIEDEKIDKKRKRDSIIVNPKKSVKRGLFWEEFPDLKDEVHSDNPKSVWNLTSGSHTSIIWKKECQPGIWHSWEAPIKRRTLSKTGCNNPSCILQRCKETNLKIRGVENPLQDPIVMKKIKETNLKNRGVEYTLQDPIVREKGIQTNLKARGVSCPLQDPSVKEKIKQTNLKIRGVENPFQDPSVMQKIKETNLKVRGVENPLQDPHVAEKVVKNSYKRKCYITPSNNILQIQGYESYALDILFYEEKYDESCILTGPTLMPEIWWFDDWNIKHRYYPDVLIYWENRLIEVKSDYTVTRKIDVIQKKLDAARNAGYNIEVWVFDKKKNLIKKLKNVDPEELL